MSAGAYSSTGGSMTPQNAFGTGRGGDSFPSPWLDMATAAMPDHNKNALEWCFVPGTLVEQADLQLTEYQEVLPGDVVFTRAGRVRPVDQTGARQVAEDIVAFSVYGYGPSTPTNVTKDHRLSVIRGVTKRNISHQLQVENEQEILAGELVVGDWIATPLIRREDRSNQQRFSGWLLGMYMAEGCTVRTATKGEHRGVRFTLGEADEVIGVLAKLLSELSEQTGREEQSYTPPSRPDTRLVTSHDPELPDWVTEHAGRYSKSKQFGPSLIHFTDEYLLNFIAGWLDGDGHVCFVDGRLKNSGITTSSRKAAYQLIRLCEHLNLTPSLCLTSNQDSTFGGGDSYTVSFATADTLRILPFSVKLQSADIDPSHSAGRTFNRVIVKDGYTYRKVSSVKHVRYEGPVHSMRVADDHSYTVNGIGVLNCEYIFQANGTYRMAMERIISYFLTDLDISSADKRKPLGDDEKEQWSNILLDTLGFMSAVQALDRDETCYGNGFMSMVVPFKRFLLSPYAPIEFSFDKMAENPDAFNLVYDSGKNQFIATCPKTKKRGAWKIDDRPDDLERKLRLKLWSPHEMEIVNDFWSGDCAYIWKIPEEYKKELRRGNMYMLERAPVEVLKAVHEDGWYRFAPDALFHLKQPTISGIRTRGWGLSKTLVNFRDVWYVQVLRRYNEAIALDYIIPFRLLTPTQRNGSGAGPESGDPLRMQNAGAMRGQINSMMRKRKRDPASWHFLPFPVDYQALGGDAQELAPHELLEQGYDIMLNSAGTPTELYRGTLQLQTAPVSLRLFEATHHSIVHGNNRCLAWLINQISQLLTLPMVQARMKRVTHADDFNKQMAALQMFMGQQLSGTTAFGGMGFEWKEEQRRIAEEASYQQQLQAELQEEMEQAAFGEQIAKGQGGGPQQPGAAPPGGDPAAQGGGGQVDPATGQPMASPVTGYLEGPNVPTTPQDMMAQSESLAQELLGLPETQKLSELRSLKQKNPVLHALVKEQMNTMRNQAQTAGGAMLLGQQGAAPPQ